MTEFKKVPAPIIGADGNIFNLLGIASRSLRAANIDNEIIQKMCSEVYESESYNDALNIIINYVEPTEKDQDFKW